MKTRHAFEKFGYSPIDDSHIRIERLEKRLKPAVPFPHKHDFFHILLLEKASGTHEIDFHRHRAEARQLFIMKPGQVHSWDFPKSTRGFVLEFTNMSFLSDQTRELLTRRLLSTSDCEVLKEEKLFAKLRLLFEMMHEEAKTKKEGYEISLRGLLEATITEMIRLAGAKGKALKEEALSAQFRALLDEHYRAQHDVAFYAKALKLSPKALTMRLKRLLQKAPSELIQERLVLEAKRLLSYSDLGIAEIGYEIGFEDPNYFSRFFKKQSRMTPAQFRLLRGKSSAL